MIFCGYLLHTRSHMLDCEKCRKLSKSEESELPDNFEPADFTLARTKNRLHQNMSVR